MARFGLRLGASAYAVGAPLAADDGSGTAFTAGLQALLQPRSVNPSMGFPAEIFLSIASVQDGWSAGPFESADLSRARVGLALGARYGLPAGRLEPFAGAGVARSYFLGDRGKTIPFPRPFSGHHSLPAMESSMYVEAGLSGAGRGPLGRLEVGVRYERTGIGHLNPFGQSKGPWDARMLSVFTTFRLN